MTKKLRSMILCRHFTVLLQLLLLLLVLLSAIDNRDQANTNHFVKRRSGASRTRTLTATLFLSLVHLQLLSLFTPLPLPPTSPSCSQIHMHVFMYIHCVHSCCKRDVGFCCDWLFVSFVCSCSVRMSPDIDKSL